MSQEDKKTIEVSIYGKTFRLKSEESEDYVRHIAKVVSDAMTEIGRGRRSISDTAIYTAMNFAEEFHRSNKLVDFMKEENEKLNSKIEGLQEEKDDLSKKIEELKTELTELSSNQKQMETLESLSGKLDAILDDDLDSIPEEKNNDSEQLADNEQFNLD